MERTPRQDEDDFVTTESLFQGRIRLAQKKTGYRFSSDALILSHHTTLKGREIAVDLGTGCGIIPIILAYRFPEARFFAVEIQKGLAELARANVRLNNLDDRIAVVHGDMRGIEIAVDAGSADAVFSNPPYRGVQAGRLSADEERAMAMHEVTLTLRELLSVACRLLKRSGRFSIIYPAVRMVDLMVQMRAFSLEPKKIRWVHSRKGLQAERAFVEGVKSGRPGIRVLPPLIVHRSDGRFTREMEVMVSP